MYLGLHKILWAILVVAYTFIEILYFGVIFLFVMLWTLRVNFFSFWEEHHSAEGIWDNHWDGLPYSDKNPWETIKRRYRIFF